MKKVEVVKESKMCITFDVRKLVAFKVNFWRSVVFHLFISKVKTALKYAKKLQKNSQQAIKTKLYISFFGVG